MSNEELIAEYLTIERELETLEAHKKKIREKISEAFPDGFNDDRINIHYKPVSVWEFSADHKHSEDTIKKLKKALTTLEETEKTSGIAKVVDIRKTLTITIK